MFQDRTTDVTQLSSLTLCECRSGGICVTSRSHFKCGHLCHLPGSRHAGCAQKQVGSPFSAVTVVLHPHLAGFRLLVSNIVRMSFGHHACHAAILGWCECMFLRSPIVHLGTALGWLLLPLRNLASLPFSSYCILSLRTGM